MTTKRLSLSILAASLACVMLLGGCGLSSAIVEGLSEEHFIYVGTTPHDPESREFREVLSRDGLTLYVNDKTAEIARAGYRRGDVVFQSAGTGRRSRGIRRKQG